MSHHPFTIVTILLSGAVAIILNFFTVRFLMRRLWVTFFRRRLHTSMDGWNVKAFKETRFTTNFKTWVETFLYAGCWVIGVPEAIAVILALTAAPSIKVWQESLAGRAAFNIWFVGSVTSVMTAILATEIILYLFPPA